MSNNKKYPIENFFVGELYLYKLFAGLSNGESIEEGEKRIKEFSNSSAICFQQDEESRYIDWENKREYIGFLTIFYKDGNDYICLHNEQRYQLDGPNLIRGLTPLSNLLPQLDARNITQISMYHGLELFDMLFGIKENQLYLGREQSISDFYVAEISIKTTKRPKEPENRIEYINLIHHLMLEQSGLDVQEKTIESERHKPEELDLYEDDEVDEPVIDEPYESSEVIYRCLLFKKDGIFYNLHNNKICNPNDDTCYSIIPFDEYMQRLGKDTSKVTTIPKALKLFRQPKQ